MAFPAAFLFDMDGLLLDTERLYLRSFLDLTAEIGIAKDEAEAFYLTLVGSSEKGATERLRVFLPGSISVDAFESRWRALHSVRLADGVPVKNHVREVLETLKAQGARMAVVTSTGGKTARHHLRQAGLFEYFEQVKAGDEVSANKPDPAPYREAAEALGVDPRDCVAFEDSDFGVRAAVAAGCRSYQIPDLRPVDKAFPDLGQKILPDLAAALRDLQLTVKTPAQV